MKQVMIGAMVALMGVACGGEDNPSLVEMQDGSVRDVQDFASPADMARSMPDTGMQVVDEPEMQVFDSGMDLGGDVTSDMGEQMPRDLGREPADMAPEGMATTPDMAPDLPVMVPDYPADWPRSRGWEWVREEEPFVSALSVRMGAAPVPQVSEYFDDFHANAIHLWEWGLPDAITSWKAARPGARWLTWVDRDGKSGVNGQVLGGAPRPSGLIGYQVGDEPRDRAHFNDVMAGFAVVKAEDPAPLRVLNFTFQADEIDAFLVEACASGDVDIFSYDRYSFGNKQFETMMKFRNAAIACGIPYWRYVKGYINDRDREKNEVQSESDMRWDAFSGLLAGFTGHTWFLYNVLYGTQEGIPTTFFTDSEVWGAPRTPRFAHAATINEELIVYGRAQTKLRSTAVSWVPGLAFPGQNPPKGISTWQPGTGGDLYLQAIETSQGAPIQDVMVGVFEDRFRDRYIMMLNPNHTHGSFPNEGDQAVTVTVTMDFSQAPAHVDPTRLRVLGPDGMVVDVPVSSTGQASWSIAPGDVVFYKYATGNGFEGYR